MALTIIISKEYVPFPIDWNILQDNTPNGINSVKKQSILNESAIGGAKTELFCENENIQDRGSAKINNNDTISTEKTIASFIP